MVELATVGTLTMSDRGSSSWLFDVSASRAARAYRARCPSSERTESPALPPRSAHTRSGAWPRPYRGLLPRLRGTFADQLPVGHPAPDDGPQHVEEPLPVRRLPGVVAERLFVQIAEQVEGLDGNVRALDRPLEQGPEVLQPVGVDLPAHVGFRVVNHAVGILGGQPVVGLEGIGVDGGPGLDVLLDLRSEGLLPIVRHVLHADAGMPVRPVAFQE